MFSHTPHLTTTSAGLQYVNCGLQSKDLQGSDSKMFYGKPKENKGDKNKDIRGNWKASDTYSKSKH